MKKVLSVALALCVLLCAASFSLAEGYDPIEFTMGTWDIVEYGDDTEQGKLLAEKYNWKVNIRNLDWGNYPETIAMWGTTDDLPELWNGYVDEAWFTNFIAENLLRDIPLETLKKHDKLYAIWQSDSVSQFLYNFYGKIYYFPMVDSMTDMCDGSWTGGSAMYYRKDWAEKLNIAEPTNLDQLLDMLIAFAKNDPDGNGTADTYGLCTTFGRMEGLFSWFNAFPNFWAETEDGYMPGYMDKAAMLDALTWMRKAYENGALDPEFKGEFSAFTSGVFGARVYHSNPGWASNVMYGYTQANPEGPQNPFDVLDCMVAVPRAEGTQATVRPHYNDTITVFAYDCSDAVLERYLDFMNWAVGEPDSKGTSLAYFDDGVTAMHYGVYGTDWEYDADGILRSNPGADGRTWSARNPSGTVARLTWGFDNEFSESLFVTGDQTVEMTRQFQTLGLENLNTINAAAANPAITFSLEASLISTEEKASFVFDHMTALAAIVSGTEDVETMYDAFVADAYAYGVQEVIDSVTEALASLK